MSFNGCAACEMWKVAGFGVDAAWRTRGTNYHAPQLLQRGQTFTKETDIWAFGCVIYELTALEPAFKSSWDICQYHNRKTPLRPSNLRVPELLYCEINESFLNKTASERPTAHDATTLFLVYSRLLGLTAGPWLISISPKLP